MSSRNGESEECSEPIARHCVKARRTWTPGKRKHNSLIQLRFCGQAGGHDRQRSWPPEQYEFSRWNRHDDTNSRWGPGSARLHTRVSHGLATSV